MASVIFDQLWDGALEREGELYFNARALSKVFSISSALESIRIARVFHNAGASFYAHCDAIIMSHERVIKDQIKSKYKLSYAEIELLKLLVKKQQEGK